MKKVDGVMLSSLDQEAFVVILGADGEPGEPDPKADDKGEKPDPADKQDEKKEDDKTPLTEADRRRLQNLEEERDRTHDARRKAEQDRDAAIKERDELKAKGATDEDAKQQMTVVTGERDALKVEVEDLRKQVAFLREPGYDWVDPDAALKLADLSKIEIKDGEILGMKVALDALAKKSPYLLKPKVTDPADKDKKPDPKKTGDTPGGAISKDAASQAEKDALYKKYPALRR